ncbi:unnamed protein product [Auanema sp. JU1783]|nr:unnamed protein product [Auanema sp. JU1783]
MTSETQEKSYPYLILAKTPQYRGGTVGWGVILSTWVVLYFWCVCKLMDGLIEWFSYDFSYNKLQLTVSLISTTLASVKDSAIEFASGKYYAYCALGGVLSCGLTHTAIAPLDLIKCRIQVNPEKYKGIVSGFKTTVAEEGVRALSKGWSPTLIGYSLQGFGKFGFYEIFKNVYADAIGAENAYLYRTALYLTASASAEFFADILLAPMEATKVRVQTAVGVPPTLRGCAPLIYRTEGLAGFFKGLPPLWMRQIPYTMMKFACFERTVELLYQYVVPKPLGECTEGEQLVVTFVAGYIAGMTTV